jgi:hypothetical protein
MEAREPLSRPSDEDRQLMREYLDAKMATVDRAFLADARKWKARQADTSRARRWYSNVYLWVFWGLFLLALLIWGFDTLGRRYGWFPLSCSSQCRMERRLERIEQLLDQRLPPR